MRMLSVSPPALARTLCAAAFGAGLLALGPALAQDTAPATEQSEPAPEAGGEPPDSIAPATEDAAPATDETTPATEDAAPAAREAGGETVAAPPEAGDHPGSEGTEAVHYPLKQPARLDWSFSGFFGRYDQAQLQRGFQVFRDICSGCHSLSLVAFRNFGDEGGPEYGEAEVRTLAAEYPIPVVDGPDETGQMFERPGRPYDRLPSPFPNAEAAAASNSGAVPPDLSLMAKSRAVGRGFPWFILDAFTQYQEGGPDYIHALLTGYEEPPEGVTVAEGLYYNPYFVSGSAIAMPPPLNDGDHDYADGSPETVDQYARDVSAFLMWTAEPHLVARKRIGFQVLIFLGVFAVLMYLSKRRIWGRVHGDPAPAP